MAGVLALRGAVRDHHLLSSGYPTARTYQEACTLIAAVTAVAATARA
jgi:hypothetical protein